MSSLSLETQSRVQCIKQKFEISDRNAIVSSKNPHSATTKQNSNLGSISLPQTSTTDFGKTEGSRVDGKVQVKRTPAFRRDKVGSVKTLGRANFSQSEEKIKNLVLKENINLVEGTESKLDPKKAEVRTLMNNNEFQNIQRSKTDLLGKYCDRKNCTKSTLVSRRINLLGENENAQTNNNLAYAVVDKSQKKKSNEKKETELKLSESLKKALQSPLPKGPPPKKPPRTFCHVMSSASSSISKSKSMENAHKDLPKLKSKLEKLENIIKNHDRNANFKADLKEETNDAPLKTTESKSLLSVFKMKNVNKNHLQLTNCMKSCTDLAFEDTLLKQKQKSFENVQKLESEHFIKTDGNEDDNNCSNSSKNFSTTEATARRSASEPIYDLPCVTNKICLDNKLIPSNESDQSSFSKPQEGLHYMCTDVVNRLNRIKPVEFSPPQDDWPQILNARVTKASDAFKENIRTTVPDGKRPTLVWMKDENLQEKQDAEVEEKENKEDSVLGKGLPVDDGKEIQSDGKSIKSDSDSWSMGSESEREWTPESDLLFQDKNETNNSCLKREILNRKIAQRKDYVNKVSSRLFNCVPYWMNLKGNNSSHLFECCLLVGLTRESEKNVPYIKNIYPPNIMPPPLIEALCFPDASNWPPKTGNEPEEQYYSLVVTNENGERKFGYCRRVLPEGGNLCLPLTYCIITPHRANGFFYKVLEELESRHGSLGMENFIRQLYEAEFPGPGEVLKLKKILEEATKTSFTPKDNCIASTLVRRPCDVRLEEKNLTQLFQYLKLSVFIKIFSSLLHERKVLLLSISLRKLSSCIEALQSTLLPFSWQHTYIPVLPVYLLETCEAPTPYVIGLLKTKNVENSLENLIFENGIMVDLDESKILKCCGDEATILPHRLIKSLKTSLNMAVNSIMLPETNRNVLISDAFIGFFVQVCGHYSKFISVSGGEKTFEKKGFVKHVTSTTVQSFLEWFIKTAMFQAFIHERLHGIVDDIPVKLFTLRAMENPTEAMKNSTVLPLNCKVLNKKVKSFSDKIKDFIQ